MRWARAFWTWITEPWSRKSRLEWHRKQKAKREMEKTLGFRR